jgi:hypothetical protein
MDKKQWSNRIGDAAAIARAGGRRRYNAQREREKWRRRFAILRICAAADELRHGFQQELAGRFGVHKSVISRDLVWVRRMGLSCSGLSPLRCSFRRGAVTVEWVNPMSSLENLHRHLLKELRKGG